MPEARCWSVFRCVTGCPRSPSKTPVSESGTTSLLTCSSVFTAERTPAVVLMAPGLVCRSRVGSRASTAQKSHCSRGQARAPKSSSHSPEQPLLPPHDHSSCRAGADSPSSTMAAQAVHVLDTDRRRIGDCCRHFCRHRRGRRGTINDGLRSGSTRVADRASLADSLSARVHRYLGGIADRDGSSRHRRRRLVLSKTRTP